ncbi:hypothetical protein [Nocardia cyriacigeorgica]|uniref:hypothetical protein n=1 Tax=Nocardia cyriacigeorgica TaxID=135487 RepID=UPI0013D5F80E|nr:hypothetical protein [Nocardia cyriacigeorgica]NEW29522.1 hypothetical protein [Nocardia cyriacigeorgica]
MTHGPDSTTCPASTHRNGAVTLAEKSTPQSAFDAAIEQMLSAGTQPPAPAAAPRARRTEAGFPVAGRRRKARDERSLARSQQFRSAPHRPLRIPGR